MLWVLIVFTINYSLDFNKNSKNKFYLTKQNNFFKQGRIIPATYDAGFNIGTLQGLLNILTSNTHMYFYWGSETTPPCREEVLWMVYKHPRSISKDQFDYLMKQLAKNKNEKLKPEQATSVKEVYGNKRSVQVK